jgi:hypothetical protein
MVHVIDLMSVLLDDECPLAKLMARSVSIRPGLFVLSSYPLHGDFSVLDFFFVLSAFPPIAHL